MTRVREGQSHQIVLPFVDAEGNAVIPVSVVCQLWDGFGGMLAELSTPSWSDQDTEVTVTIPAELNTLDGAVREARILRTEFRLDPAGPYIVQRHSYVVEADETLKVMVNSFMTYEAAELMAEEIANIPGWNASTRETRAVALTHAFRRITRLRLKYVARDDQGRIDPYATQTIDSDMWPEITLDAWLSMPTHFKRALRAAQFIDANDLLKGDKIGEKRRAGIISETVGESAMRFDSSHLEMGLSPLAMDALAGYIDLSIRIARA